MQAIDVDPSAVVATRANAVRNGLAGIVSVTTTPLAEMGGRYDVIVVNIAAPTLVTLAAAVQSRLAPGGWLGMSGLSPAQVSVVAAAYDRLTVRSLPQSDDWAAVVATPGPD